MSRYVKFHDLFDLRLCMVLDAQEQAKAETKPEEKKTEEKKEEPKPPSPFVLFVDLHCVGCAKKIERSILNIKGTTLSLSLSVCCIFTCASSRTCVNLAYLQTIEQPNLAFHKLS